MSVNTTFTIIIFIVLLLLGVLPSGASSAFAYCSSLTSVVLMNGLLGLGAGLFYLSGVTSIVIPSTITSYGLINFVRCF